MHLWLGENFFVFAHKTDSEYLKWLLGHVFYRDYDYKYNRIIKYGYVAIVPVKVILCRTICNTNRSKKISKGEAIGQG